MKTLVQEQSVNIMYGESALCNLSTLPLYRTVTGLQGPSNNADQFCHLGCYFQSTALLAGSN